MYILKPVVTPLYLLYSECRENHTFIWNRLTLEAKHYFLFTMFSKHILSFASNFNLLNFAFRVES